MANLMHRRQSYSSIWKNKIKHIIPFSNSQIYCTSYLKSLKQILCILNYLPWTVYKPPVCFSCSSVKFVCLVAAMTPYSPACSLHYVSQRTLQQNCQYMAYLHLWNVLIGLEIIAKILSRPSKVNITQMKSAEHDKAVRCKYLLPKMRRCPNVG